MLVLQGGTAICAGVTFTTNTWISAGDVTYDGQDVVVDGCTLTIDGEHSFASLRLMNSATLTHPACTTGQTFRIDLNITGAVVVDAGSAIDATARGFVRGYTVGNSTNGAATETSGGSYGGMGVNAGGGTANCVYGDYRDPNEHGSGAGAYYSGSGSGGGLIRIAAGALTNDGVIAADGGAPANGYPSGSGGGIRIDAPILAGSGVIRANGGDASGNFPCGGGGRIALYYTSGDFNVLSNVSARGGARASGGGGCGTVYLKRPGQLGELRIVSHGALVGAWTPLGTPADARVDLDHLLISGSNVVVMPEHTMPVRAASLVVTNGGVVSHRTADATTEYALQLEVTGTLHVAADGRIDVSARGYMAGRSAGNSTENGSSGYSGGSHGGRGYSYYGGVSGGTYGNAANPAHPGGGGGHAGYACNGGGLAHISARTLVVDGRIAANGADSSGGGGAGGSVRINAGTLRGTGRISADGGTGISSGGGGGGRVALYTYTANQFPTANVTAAGGPGTSGLTGDVGSVVISTDPLFDAPAPYQNVLHGIANLDWTALGVDPAHLVIDIYATRNGVTYTLALGASSASAFRFDTSVLPDGVYTIRVVFRHAVTGAILGETSYTVMINNSLRWMSGTLTGSTYWAAGQAYVVEGTLVVTSGTELVIAPGAVVKFARGAMLHVAASATLTATGTVAQPIYFTSLRDDEVGGDSNMDGNATQPQPGDWLGIRTGAGAVLNLNEHTYVRYARNDHSGVIASSEDWPADFLHYISGDVTIPAGVTLTIRPGAVVKFAVDRSMIVNAGGALRALGNAAQPVVFTSWRDDTAGGDSNGDGTSSRPEAGDWKWILINGGSGVCDYCEVRYGGGPAAGGWGPPGGPGKAAIKTYAAAHLWISNSVIRDAYYDGVLCWGGPVWIVNSVLRGIDRAVCAHPGSPVTVVNCTLDDNRVGLLLHGGVLTGINTIVHGSYTAGVLHDFGGGAPWLSYCALWNPQATAGNYSGTPDQTGLRGNVITNPAFRGAAQGSYELGFLSPCIDAADTLAAPLSDSKGNPRVNDPRTTPRGIPNGSGVYADIGACEFVDDAPSPIDLIAQNVSGDTIVTAGMQAVVSWEVANIGSMAASGQWYDAVYLAPVNAGAWDTPALAGEVMSSGVSAPNAPLARSAVVRVPGGTEGQWRWQVNVNARGTVFEGRNRNNNTGGAQTQSALAVPLLQNETAVTSAYAAAGAAAWYKILLAPTQSVLVTLDSAAASGNCWLAAGYNSMPTATNYHVRSSAFNSPDARITVSAGAAARTAYLRIMPEELAGSLTYILRAEPSRFMLESIGVTNAGNRGIVSIPFSGAGFAAGMSAALRPAAGTDVVAHTVALADASSALAVFDLTGVPPGMYGFAAQLDGTEELLPNALRIVAGTGGRLETRIIVPANVRDGRPFTGYLEYWNAGDADLAAPLLTVQGMSSGITVWDMNAASNTAAGVSWLGVAQDSPLPSVLGIGPHYTIPFRAAAAGVSYAPFSVFIVQTNDATVMDYSGLEEVIGGPEPHPLWSNSWQRFITDAGALRGGYVAALGRAVNRAKRFGLSLIAERDILSFIVREGYEAVQHAAVGGLVCFETTNQPLPEVIVRLASTDISAGVATQVFQTATWYDGTFGVRGVAPGTYTLAVEGYLPSPARTITLIDPDTAPLRDLVIVVSAQMASVRGYVRDGSAGAGVAHAVVTAEALDTLDVYSAITDADGYYQIKNLPPGMYMLTAVAPGWPPCNAVHVTLAAGQGVLQSFALTRGGAVTGRVYAPGGTAVAGARVAVDAASQAGSLAATSDATGAFTCEGLPPGRYTLRASAAGYGASLPVEITMPASLTTQTTSLWLLAAGRITGFVRDADTLAPLAGVFVGSDAYPPLDDIVYTAADGSFTLNNLAAGIYTLTAVTNNYMLTDVIVTNTGMATPPVTILMGKAGSVSGVVRRNGQPAGGAAVMLRAPGGQFRALTAGDDGAYGVRNLPTGTYHIAAGSPGGPLQDWHTFTVAPAQRDWAIDLAISAARLAGRVMAADGTTPVYNARVTLVSGADEITSTRTDSDGRYAFDVYQPGAYTLLADSYTMLFSPHSITVTGTEQRAGLDFTAPGNALHIALTHNGAPPPPALVQLLYSADPTSNTLTLAAAATNGLCAFSHLPTGHYDIIVVAPSCAYSVVSCAVSTGSNAVHVALDAGRRISGSVRIGALGLPHVRVSLADARGEFLLTRTEADGSFAFTSVPTGIFTLTALPFDTYAPVVSNGLDLRTASALAVTLNVTPLASNVIAGRVTTTAGAAVADALLRLTSADGVEFTTASTGSDGTYAGRSWPAGTFVLTASRDGHRPARRNLTMQAGSSQTDIDLTLSTPLAAPAAPGTSVTRAPYAAMGIFDRLTDYLSGASYLQPPHKIIGQLNIPDYRVLWADAQRRGSDTCDGARDAYWRCASMDWRMWLKQSDWDRAYSAVRDVNYANVMLVLSRSGLVTAKGLKLLANIAQFAGYDPASIRFESPELGVFLDLNEKAINEALSLINNNISLARSKLLKGDFKDLGGYLSVIRNAMFVIEKVGGIQLKKCKILYELLSTAKSIDEYLGDLKDFENDAVRGYMIYDEAGRQWFSYYHSYLQAYAALRAATSDCKGGRKPPPPPRPPVPPGNNGGSGGSRVTGSYDPNDKYTTGAGTRNFIRADETIYYTISYENMPTASAPAQVVVVTDTLSPLLDIGTLALGPLSFNNTDVSVPGGIKTFSGSASVATDTNPVRITAALDLASRSMRWEMASYDPSTGDLPEDPFAGFLPPNTSNHIGEGQVTFTIKPVPGLPTGTVISNRARIVFDVNAPIDTPWAVNTIDATAPASSVAPLPASSGYRTFTVSWSGSDVGSGVASYDIYVSTDGGAYILWQNAATNTSALFTGAYGHTYAFYSIARDFVNNQEATPAAPDTTTAIALLPPSAINASDGAYTGRVAVAWNSMSDAPAHTVYRATTDNPAAAAPLATVSAAHYNDLAVVPGVRYYYWVAANDGTSDGALSAVSDRGFAALTATAVWKYKDGKKNDTLAGKNVEPNFVPFFLDGWQIGIAGMNGEVLSNISGPYALFSKSSKNTKWTRKPADKKNPDAQITYAQSPKAAKLIYKYWGQMPLGMIVYVAPSNSVPVFTQAFGSNAVQVLLVPMDAADTSGWIRLAPTVIEPPLPAP